jgi:hypothetical protein
MSQPTFHITADDWGYENCISEFTVRVGKDPRLVRFGGDGYWQWGESCLRNYDKNCSWTQALHDSLMGWHSCVLHTGDTLTILPHHPDYERVRQLVDDVDNGRSLPTDVPDQLY